MDNWEKSVYGEKEEKFYKQYWIRVRKEVFERDKYTCKSCHSHRGLSVHHIIPRSELKDDIDDLENLVTLCYNCHDIIEMDNIRTIAEIKNYCWEPKRKNTGQCENYYIETNCSDWHQWVYGGYKKPPMLKKTGLSREE